MSDEVDFLHEDDYESFLQIDSMILMGMIKYSQSSQNSMFTLFLQYLKKEFRDEVDFLHSDKQQSFSQVDFNTGYQSFLQDDTIIVDRYDQAFSKYSKVTSLQYLYNIY